MTKYSERTMADPNAPVTQREPSLLVGVATAALTGLLAVLGVGGFDDGFQWIPDGVTIAGPIAAALGIRTVVDSPAETERKRRVAYRAGQQGVTAETSERRG